MEGGKKWSEERAKDRERKEKWKRRGMKVVNLIQTMFCSFVVWMCI